MSKGDILFVLGAFGAGIASIKLIGGAAGYGLAVLIANGIKQAYPPKGESK